MWMTRPGASVLDSMRMFSLDWRATAVLPDVISPFELAAFDAADEAQQFVGDSVHTRASSFSSGQRTFANRAPPGTKKAVRCPLEKEDARV